MPAHARPGGTMRHGTRDVTSQLPDDDGLDHGAAYWRSAVRVADAAAHANQGMIDAAELKVLANYLPTPCSIANAAGQTIWCNKRWFDYCGTTLAAMQNNGWHNVHTPDELPDVVRRWAQAVEDGAPFELVINLRGGDGVFRPFLTRAWPLLGPDGKPLRWFVACTEIGAQLAAEAALRAENAAHRALIETQQAIGASHGDTAAMLHAVAEGALLACQSACGAGIEWLDKDELTQAAAAGSLRETADALTRYGAAESRLCLADGRPRICDARVPASADGTPSAPRCIMVVPIFRHGRPNGVLKLVALENLAFGERDLALAQLFASALAGGFADAAEAAATRQLRDSEARFELITHSVGHLIWSAPQSGIPDFFSNQWHDFVGQDPAHMPAEAMAALLHPDEAARLHSAWRQSITTGAPFEQEHRLRHHDGRFQWVLTRATRLEPQSGREARWYGTTTDIHSRRSAENKLRELNDTLEQRIAHEVAERAKAEAAFRQSQKMEAVGQLTGGIAHDFNNLLTVISGNLEIATRALDAGDPQGRAFRALDSAMKGAERAAALTQGLLAFARLQPLAPRALDISRLIGGMSDLLNRALGETIRLVIEDHPGLWPVEADHNQLENAILNLAVNARDAMPMGGQLTITTENAVFDAALAAQFAGFKPGEFAVITVSDTGIGMPPEVMARVFEPFFTTKEVGRGTGLGLSQVYGFVKQSGGYIRVTSQPGHGTVVTIYLPRLSAALEDAAPAALPAATRAQSTATILVVEDDPDVRMFSVESVRELGYHVLEAEDGITAMETLRHRPDCIDLLFTDIVMPGMSGVDLAAAALELRPTLKILYTSGYTRDAMDKNERAAAELLIKPFTFAALAAKLRDVLDGRGSATTG